MAREKFPIQGTGGGGGGSNFAAHEFTSAETWNAVSGISSGTLVNVHVDLSQVTKGSIDVEVDGNLDFVVFAGEVESRIISADSTVDVISNVGSNVFDLTQISPLQEATIEHSSKSQHGPQNGLRVRDDGKKFWAIQGSSTRHLVEWNAGTAWDISTLTEGDTLAEVDSSGLEGFAWKPDGTELYLIYIPSSVYTLVKFTLSTAWDLTTATDSGVEVNLETDIGDISAKGLFFKPDGKKFYVLSETGATVKIHEWNMSTPWDISSETYVGAFEFTTLSDLYDFWITQDGSKLYVTNGASGATYIERWDFGTAWEVATLSDTGQEFNVSSFATWVRSLCFRNDGRYAYFGGDDGATDGTIGQYDTTDAAEFTGTGRSSINY